MLLASDGRWITPEPVAIDWTRVESGRLFEGDGSQNSQWFGHGEPIYSATGGRVVQVEDDYAEVPPFTFLADDPTLRGPRDFGGNHVTVRVRRGVYAFYGHIMPGTISVREGQRVSAGRKLGSLGNTGNTSAPHLHFGAHRRRRPARVQQPALRDQPVRLRRHRRAVEHVRADRSCDRRSVRRAHPLSNAIGDF